MSTLSKVIFTNLLFCCVFSALLFGNSTKQSIDVVNFSDLPLSLQHSIPAQTVAEIEITLRTLSTAQDTLLKGILSDSEDIVKKAIAAGANVNQEIKDKLPLVWAVLMKRHNIVLLLIDLGARINKDFYKNIINIKEYKIAEMLLKKNIIDISNIDNTELLILIEQAMRQRDIESATFLIKNKKNIFDKRNISSIHNLLGNLSNLLQNKKGLELFQYLMKNENFFCQNLQIWSEAIGEAKRDDYSILEILVKHNPNQIIAHGQGTTPLFMSIVYDNKRIVEFILKSGANVNQKIDTSLYTRDLPGENTPLLFARIYGKHDIAELLEKYGAEL